MQTKIKMDHPFAYVGCSCSKLYNVFDEAFLVDISISSLKTTGPIEAKLQVEPPWDRERKFIQMIRVICCSSLLSTSGGAGAFSRDLTINLSPSAGRFAGLKTLKS